MEFFCESELETVGRETPATQRILLARAFPAPKRGLTNASGVRSAKAALSFAFCGCRENPRCAFHRPNIFLFSPGLPEECSIPYGEC
jgi:hypothetical protein